MGVDAGAWVIQTTLSVRSKNGEGLFSAPFPLPPSNSKQFSARLLRALKPSICAVCGRKLGSAAGVFSSERSPNGRHSPKLGSSTKNPQLLTLAISMG